MRVFDAAGIMIATRSAPVDVPARGARPGRALHGDARRSHDRRPVPGEFRAAAAPCSPTWTDAPIFRRPSRPTRGEEARRCATTHWIAGDVARRPPRCCSPSTPTLHGQDGFRFKSGVELVNVNITVTDRTGRFVEGLRQEDFIVYDDNKEQEITHFTAERVPVSLGVALDTSGSMVGEKIESARAGHRPLPARAARRPTTKCS